MLSLFVWFLWWTSMSDAGMIENAKGKEPAVEQGKPLKLDKLTAAAVNMKGLVRQQWVDSEIKNTPPSKDLLQLPMALFEVFKPFLMDQLGDVMEQVSDFADDFGVQFESIAGDLMDIDVDAFQDMAKARFEREIAGNLSPEFKAVAERKMMDSIVGVHRFRNFRC